MNIVGLIKNSFIDYPKHISSVIFTPGCNMNCWYCHNRDIITMTEGTIDQDYVLEFLDKRKSFLDGVVISGGEPTMQSDLVSYIEKIKAMGYKVKLDTNGTNVAVLKELVNNKLIDYIAMDVKAPLDDYNKVTSVPDIEELKRAIEYIKECGVDYEFRTTYLPNLTKQDIMSILKTIKGAKTYSLQAYIKPDFIKNDKMKHHMPQEFEELKELGQSYVDNFNIKNI